MLTSIPEDEYNLIISYLINENIDLKFNFDELNFCIENIFELCYKLDENEDSRHYKLLDMSTIFAGLTSIVHWLNLFWLIKSFICYFRIE